MKKLLIHIAYFLIPIIGVMVLLLNTSLDKSFAYHFIKGNCYNHGSWIYDRIYKNDLPVDVAFVGSSRTLHAINEPVIEQLLNENSMNIVNLGYCQFGRNFQYVVLADLLEMKKPKLVIIEVTEDEQPYSHQSFPYIAKTSDVIRAPFHKAYFADLYKNVVVKWEYLKERFVFKQFDKSINNESHGYAGSDRITNQTEVEQNQLFWKRRFSRINKNWIERKKAEYPFHYLGKTIHLLEENQINYCFLYVPFSFSKIEKPGFIDFYQAKANVYQIESNEYEAYEFWMDASHFNDKGSLAIAEKMVDLINNELCKMEN